VSRCSWAAAADAYGECRAPALFLALRREATSRVADHAAKAAALVAHGELLDEASVVLAGFDDVAAKLASDRDADYKRYWESTDGPEAGNDDAFRTCAIMSAVEGICAHEAQTCSLVGFLADL